MCFFTFKICPWLIYYTLIIVFLFTISSLTNLTVCSLYFNWYTLAKLKSAYYVFKQIILCIAGIYSKVHGELNFVLRLMPWPKSSIWGFHLCIDNLVIKMEGSNWFVLGIRLYLILQDSLNSLRFKTIQFWDTIVVQFKEKYPQYCFAMQSITQNLKHWSSIANLFLF